jgi:two-component sensor histidine kinase
VWSWEVQKVHQLAGVRSDIRRRLRDHTSGPAVQSPAAERLLLAVEELTSNALRHGEHPIRTAITVTDVGWLLVVTDGAGDRPPVQAVDRDPANGGLGLRLTAVLASSHGWVTEDSLKHVWAYLPFDPGNQLS